MSGSERSLPLYERVVRVVPLVLPDPDPAEVETALPQKGRDLGNRHGGMRGAPKQPFEIMPG